MSSSQQAPAGSELRLCALLLAAGGSRRLGQPKQLLEREGQTLIRHAARLARRCAENLVVVLGAHAESVRAALKGMEAEFVRNPRWVDGMGGSIACGMTAVDDNAAGVMILLCDQYRLEERSLAALVRAWRRQPGCITAARWPGGFGPPAIFPAGRFADLRALTGDQGARKLVAADRSSQYVELPEAAFDVDRPSDLAALEGSPSK